MATRSRRAVMLRASEAPRHCSVSAEAACRGELGACWTASTLATSLGDMDVLRWRLRCEREPNRVSCGAPPELSLPAAPAHSPGVARAPGPRRGSCYGTIVGAVLGWRLVSAPRCPQLGRPNRHLHRHGVEKNLIHCRPAWWTRRMRAAIGPMTCALGASRALRRAEPRGRAAARPR